MEEQRGAVWLEQRERGGQREEGGREGTGRSCRALWAAGRTWALSLREAGATEGCGQGREGLDGRSRVPPAGLREENRLWRSGESWGPGERTVLDQVRDDGVLQVETQAREVDGF
jgi:hypothetical protein